MPNVLRRVPSDKPWAVDVNYLIDFVTGNRVGGQLNIEDDTGQELDVDGTELSAGNCAVHIASGIGKALCVDDGALFSGPVDMDGPVDVDGTLNVDGTAHLTNTLTVDGASVFKAPMTVNHSGTGVPQLTVTNAGVTALLVDGTVFTADLAVGAVTDTSSAMSFAGSVTSTSLVKVGSTITFTSDGGRHFFTWASAIGQATANGQQALTYRLDGGADQYIHYETMAAAANGSRGGEWDLGVLSAGTHSVEVWASVSAGRFDMSPAKAYVREFKR